MANYELRVNGSLRHTFTSEVGLKDIEVRERLMPIEVGEIYTGNVSKTDVEVIFVGPISREPPGHREPAGVIYKYCDLPTPHAHITSEQSFRCCFYEAAPF